MPTDPARPPGPAFSGHLALRLARQTIAHALHAADAAPAADALPETGACFVTLHKYGALRGCIGTLEAHRSLGEDVVANARAAAFRDPRFEPVTREEWPQITLEVSLLEPAEQQTCPTEAAAISWIEPPHYGVVLASGGRRATFLPQVWRQLPEPSRFLLELRRKAGMPSGSWPADMLVGRYRVRSYDEHEA